MTAIRLLEASRSEDIENRIDDVIRYYSRTRFISEALTDNGMPSIGDAHPDGLAGLFAVSIQPQATAEGTIVEVTYSKLGGYSSEGRFEWSFSSEDVDVEIPRFELTKLIGDPEVDDSVPEEIDVWKVLTASGEEGPELFRETRVRYTLTVYKVETSGTVANQLATFAAISAKTKQLHTIGSLQLAFLEARGTNIRGTDLWDISYTWLLDKGTYIDNNAGFTYDGTNKWQGTSKIRYPYTATGSTTNRKMLRPPYTFIDVDFDESDETAFPTISFRDAYDDDSSTGWQTLPGVAEALA